MNELNYNWIKGYTVPKKRIVVLSRLILSLSVWFLKRTWLPILVASIFLLGFIGFVKADDLTLLTNCLEQ